MAIIAWLKGQQSAAQRVRSLLEAAERREQKPLINIVNLGEIFYASVKARDLAYGERVLDALRPRLAVIPATNSLVITAATLKSRHGDLLCRCLCRCDCAAARRCARHR